MAKMTIVFAIVFNTVVITFLTTGNSLAISNYSQKYGIACKSCHPSGSELNELGQKFWKNGHSFGDNNTELLEILKQSPPGVDKKKAGETPGKSSDKPAAVQGKTDTPDTPVSVVEAPEVAQPLPETKVYRWKAADGTLHFSDTPDMNPPPDKIPASAKSGKRNTRTGFKPLSAIVPKSSQKYVTTKPPKAVSLKSELPAYPEAAKIEIKADVKHLGFEECMEQALVSMPHPETADAAMDQFRKAEDACAPYKKMQPRFKLE